jgi:hypothetical protein
MKALTYHMQVTGPWKSPNIVKLDNQPANDAAQTNAAAQGEKMTTTVAAVQMVSTPDVADNLATARRLVAEAAGRGASLVTLPEYWPIMGMADTDKVARRSSRAPARSRISWRRRRASTASG